MHIGNKDHIEHT